MTATSEVDLEEELDRLYALPASEFVAARDALARSLRKVDRAAAEQVRALRRPAIHAWVANQLWWHHRAPFERLLAAGRALRGEAEGDDPIGEQRAALRTLLGAARGLLEEAGHPVDPWFDRVRTLLFAVASGAGTPGRLGGDADEPDLDVMFGVPARPKAQAGQRPKPKPKADPRALRRRQRAEERVRELEARLADEEATLARLEEEADEALARRDRAKTRVEATARALAKAEADR